MAEEFLNVEKLPVVVFYHGGGFCIGSLEGSIYQKLGNDLASKGMIVISANYRLAPENPFPAGVEDCHDVLKWVFTTDSLPKRCDLSPGVVLCGDSAGANLSCVMTSLARDGLDADLRPCSVPIKVFQQILLYPPLFFLDVMMQEYDGRHWILYEPIMSWFAKSYIRDATPESLELLVRTDRRLAPLVAGFHDYPPTVITTAGLDPLKEFGIKAVKLLKEQPGVQVTHRHYPKAVHGFATFAFLKDSKKEVAMMCEDVLREYQAAKQKQQSKDGGSTKNVSVGKVVELALCKGSKGRITKIRTDESIDIAVVDMGWGIAYAPVQNLLVVE